MKAIQLTGSVPHYLLTKALGAVCRPAFWGPLSMLQYREVPEPTLPGSGWVKVKTRYGGICGSDLQAILERDSPVPSAFLSFPFTMGHESMGVIAEAGPQVKGFAAGDRVVVLPVLPCAARGISDPCPFCRQGEFSRCQNFTAGDLRPGLAIGLCASTGGAGVRTLSPTNRSSSAYRMA